MIMLSSCDIYLLRTQSLTLIQYNLDILHSSDVGDSYDGCEHGQDAQLLQDFSAFGGANN